MNGCIIFSEDESYTLEEKNFLKSVIVKTYTKERISVDLDWELFSSSDFPTDRKFYVLHGKNTSSVFFKKMVDLGIFTRKEVLERSSVNLPKVFVISFNYDLKHLQVDKDEKVKVFKFLTSDNLVGYLKNISSFFISKESCSEEIKEEKEEDSIQEDALLVSESSNLKEESSEEVIFSIDHILSQVKDKGSLKNFKNVELFSDVNPERKILVSSSARETDGHVSFTDLISLIKICELSGFNKIMFRKK